MRKFLVVIFALALIFAQTSVANEQPPSTNVQQQAKAKIQTFANKLKTQLSQAIKTGGFEAGIEVCHTQAPIIADQLSNNGWKLSRVSLKARNINNRPLPWQKNVLEQFEKEKAQGINVNQLKFVSEETDKFTMMKAIPTGQVCLACHGKNIAEPIVKKIKQHYPSDLATGFKLGDIRGAFVIEKRK